MLLLLSAQAEPKQCHRATGTEGTKSLRGTMVGSFPGTPGVRAAGHTPGSALVPAFFLGSALADLSPKHTNIP